MKILFLANMSLNTGPGTFARAFSGAMSNMAQFRAIDLSKTSKFHRVINTLSSYDIYHISGLSWPEAHLISSTRAHSLIYTAHGYALMETRIGFSYPKRLLRSEQVLFREARAVVSVSHKLADILITRAGLARERVLVIPPCIEPMARTGARFEFPYILFVGKASGLKGLEFVLRVWDGLRRDLSDHRLVVLGYPKKLWQQMPRVVWLQPVPHEDMSGLISGASALINASQYESFGMPPVEAASLGVVPVVSTGAGLSDFLRERFPELVFEAGDLRSGRNALFQAVKHPPDPKGLVEWARGFSPENIAAQYLELYASLKR